MTIGNVPNASGYTLQFSTNPDFTNATTLTKNAAGSYGITNLAANTTYYVRVKAIGNGIYADSDWSVTVSATTDKISLTSITISGTAEVGKTLATTLKPSGATATYQWYRGDTAIPNATGSTYTVTTADIGYTIKVTATGTGIYTGSVTSAPTSVVPKIALAAPPLTASSTGPHSISVTIGNVPNASGYTLQYSTNPDFTNATTLTKNAAGSYNITGLAANTTYYVRAKAIGTGIYADSDWSVTASATTDAIPSKITLTAPTLTAYSTGAHSISVTIGNVPNASGYTLQYSTNPDFTNATTLTKNAAGSYNITGLAANTTYYVRVKAMGNGIYADSDWSVTVSVTTDKASLTSITISGYSGTYDKASHGATLSGTQSGDTIRYSSDGKTYSTSALTYTNAGYYTVYVKVSRSGYTDWTGSANISIGQKQLTVTGTTVSDKFYDGTTTATVVCGTVSGVISGDAVTVTASGVFPNSEVGTHNVTVRYTLSGSAKANYIAPVAETISGEIKGNVSSIIVTTLNDVVDANDGVVSLREAIDQVETGGTITFASSLAGGTITLGGAQLEIAKSLTIDAAALWNSTENAPGITINANKASRVFYITGGSDESPVSLIGLTITGGKTSYNGGGIDNNGTSTLTNCIISDNSAFGGGGIYNYYGNLTLTNCTNSGNSASEGGGIYNNDYDSTLTLYNSIVAGNTATNSGNDIYSNGGTANAYNVLSSYNEWTASESCYGYDASKPLFVDPAKGDYHLAVNSQAIDKGNNAYAVYPDGSAILTDLAGKARIVGSAVDLGAYEYGAKEYKRVQEGCSLYLCVSDLMDTSRLGKNAQFFWDLSGSNEEEASNFDPTKGAAFWTSVWELGFAPGDHTIRLKVQNGETSSQIIEAMIHVIAVPPTIYVKTSNYADGQVLLVSLDVYSPSNRTVRQWSIDWGDDNSSVINSCANALKAAHYYEQGDENKTYTVSLVLTGADGSDTETYTIARHFVKAISQNNSIAADLILSIQDDSALAENAPSPLSAGFAATLPALPLYSIRKDANLLFPQALGDTELPLLLTKEFSPKISVPVYVSPRKHDLAIAAFLGDDAQNDDEDFINAETLGDYPTEEPLDTLNLDGLFVW